MAGRKISPSLTSLLISNDTSIFSRFYRVYEHKLESTFRQFSWIELNLAETDKTINRNFFETRNCQLFEIDNPPLLFRYLPGGYRNRDAKMRLNRRDTSRRVIKRRVTRTLYIIQTGARSVIAHRCFCAPPRFRATIASQFRLRPVPALALFNCRLKIA